jgi:hypothetical protein
MEYFIFIIKKMEYFWLVKGIEKKEKEKVSGRNKVQSNKR